MPLYEYYCSDCNSKFELLVGHRHADDIVCTKCHSEKVRRLLSVFSLASRISGEGSYDGADTSLEGGSCGCGEGNCGCH